MIWRDGFEDWKAVKDVHEVAQQLFPRHYWGLLHRLRQRRFASP
jgi:hypothetical protein